MNNKLWKFFRFIFFQVALCFFCFLTLEVIGFFYYYALLKYPEEISTDSSLEEIEKGWINRLYPQHDEAKGFAKYTGIGAYDVWKGHRLVPNTKPYGLRVNSYGFISNFSHPGNDPYLETPPPKNAKRIFILGGSTVLGMGTSRNEETIASHLEKYLNRQGRDETFEVINAGVQSYTSSQSFVYTALELVNYYPDVFITFDGSNDLGNCSMVPFFSPNRGSSQRHLEQTLAGNARLLHSEERFLDNVFYYTLNRGKFLAKIYLQHGHIPKVMGSFSTSGKTNRHFKLYEEGITYYRRSVLNMAALTGGYDISYCAIFQPQSVVNKPLTSEEELFITDTERSYPNFRYNTKKFYVMASKMYGELHERFKDSGVLIRDFSGLFADRDHTLYVDANHYNDEGNEIISAAIGDLILKQVTDRNVN